MKKDHLAFLVAGLAFGFLFGFGLFKAIATRPGAEAAPASASADIPMPAGPAAPTETVNGAPNAGGGGAPMMAEINSLKERVTKDPKDVPAWTRLGNIYHDARMFPQALDFYKRVLELTPNDANVLTDTGICYQEMQQYDKALEMFGRAQKADPANWQSLYNTVVVAGLGMGRFDVADPALARLQQIHPDAPNLAELRVALDKARAGAAPASR
ncbi:MAG TPA: tetratricopeptide repeat protein [Candidatus Polarisedimenticolaceae bacterium]|nr:tetratricopeptide repeat protein [Candidatus Polarisedimenticolaceae bacterium]